MKKVKIEYEYLNAHKSEFIVMSISTDFPKFSKKRKLYLYELGSIAPINIKMQNYLDSDKHLSANNYLSPIVLNLTNAEFNEVQDYLLMEDDEVSGTLIDRPTAYEDVEFFEDYARVNMAINILRKDPKFWEC